MSSHHKSLCLLLLALPPTVFGCSGQTSTDEFRVYEPVSDDASRESDARPDRQTSAVAGVTQPVPTVVKWYTTTRLLDEQGVREFEIEEESRKEGFVFLFVHARVPGPFLWEKTGDSFYEAPAERCTILAPSGTIAVAEAWTTDAAFPFSKSRKTAFMPDPPGEDEHMLFAFAVDQKTIEAGSLRFQYGDMSAVSLSDELRVVEE